MSVVPADRFRALTGRDPEGIWQAPGRVNLIGDHTDYNGGLALPFAIERRTAVAVARRRDRRWRLWSEQRPGEPADVDLADLRPEGPGGWERYVLGVAWALRAGGVDVPGADIVVDSDVPLGSGLSSSASLVVAVTVAVADLAGAGLDRERLVAVAHDAEARYVGAPTGTLDQRAVLFARAGHGLLIDFRSGATVAVPLEAATPLVVVDTGVRHDHASGGYGERRRECTEAAAALGLPDLRDATVEMAEERLTGPLAARARHVLTENGRVAEAARRLLAGEAIGELLTASHRSLRDDFAVSCPELDAVVEATLASGAAGARMTGGGFGGSALVLGLAAGEVAEALGGRREQVFGVEPRGPAGRVA
ncbi:MAG: galactokinase [Acidimicrobiales bacterium]